jgi:GNAT superfamily N-acetyltransferase
MGAETEIIEVEPTGDLVDAVIRLGNGPAKQTLGFLPDQGFLDRARKGTLVAAVEGDQLLGYLLYDLPRQEVKIVHLCVTPHAQGKGIARRLIEEISKKHANRQRILLWCRDDYADATAVWKALDFRPELSRPGRSKEGHLLIAWVRDFGHPTLFDLEDERAIAALDHNVFLDLHMDPEERPQGEESRYLLTDWIGEYVELCITTEVLHEIQNHADVQARETERGWARLYRNISKADTAWRDLLDEVAALAPKAGRADHRHVARAVAAEAAYLVTRDQDLLDAAESIESALDLAVLSPAGLIGRLDRMRANDPYEPVALQGTELSQVFLSADTHNDALAALLNHGRGEKRSKLDSRLRSMLADRDGHEVRVVQGAGGQIIAGFARCVVDRRLEVPFIRVVPGTKGANTIARQLVFEQRKHAADHRLEEVRVLDPNPSKNILEALKLEHFETAEDGWVCQVKTGLVEAPDLGIAGSFAAEEAINHESRYWPVKVAGAQVPNYLVPIKVSAAANLFDTGLAEQSLLPRETVLGLSREHVYYRKPRNSRGIVAGARILWYVTGDSPIHLQGSIRAISQVAEVVEGPPRILHARFERLGVYSLEQVSKAANGNGQVMAIRFVNTEVLERPISLDDLKALWAEHGGHFAHPLSPTLIGEHMFGPIYSQSSAYAA